MADRRASAPGKVILCGEYAVLDAAPAVAMAVDRRAVATVASASGDVSSVTTPGFAPGTRRFRAGDSGADWLDGGPPIPLIDAACSLGVLNRSTAVDVVLDTRAFAEQGDKLGVGSSAATAVALAAATGSGDTPAVAYQMHEVLQRGRGSGIDIATALHGGLIAYRRADRSVIALEWPEGLAFELLWSRVPADTVERIRRLERTPHQTSRTSLAASAAACALAWQSGKAQAVLDAMREFVTALQTFDVDHGLGIFEAGHDKLVAAASDGVVYKPCGAGGGDVGIAIGRDPAELASFAARAEQFGFSRLPVAPDPMGVDSNGTRNA